MNENLSIHEQFSRKDQEALDELEQKFGVDSWQVAEFRRLLETEKEKRELNIPPVAEGEKGKLLKQIDKVMDLIDSVSLIQKNKEDQKLLQSQKKVAKKLIQEAIKSVEAYTLAVEALNQTVVYIKNIENEEKRKEKIQSSDERRRQAHEALISSINSATRYIIEHFSVVSEKRLDDIEDKFEARGEKFLDLERVIFPHQIFLPDEFEIKNRESIGKWATLLTEELINYRKKLVKNNK